MLHYHFPPAFRSKRQVPHKRLYMLQRCSQFKIALSLFLQKDKKTVCLVIKRITIQCRKQTLHRRWLSSEVKKPIRRTRPTRTHRPEALCLLKNKDLHSPVLQKAVLNCTETLLHGTLD